MPVKEAFVGLRLPGPLKEKLDALSRKYDMSFSEVMRDLIEQASAKEPSGIIGSEALLRDWEVFQRRERKWRSGIEKRLAAIEEKLD